jgi:hypothetical protein
MKLLEQSLSTQPLKMALLVLLTSLAVGCGSSSNTDDEEFIDEEPIDNGGVVTEIGDGVGSVAPDKDGLCDGESKNDGWTDNCTLNQGGTYGDSSYTKGVQRIAFCLGINPSNSTTIDAFADGLFGPNTEAAVEEFQRRRDKSDANSFDSTILVDGIVGPQTWGELEDVLDSPEVFDNEYYSYAVNGADCGLEAQFYQRGTANFDWKMAKTPGSIKMIQFSIDKPNVE